MLDVRNGNSILRIELRIELLEIDRSANFVRFAPRTSCFMLRNLCFEIMTWSQL